jgi:hypothetical protein
MPKGKDPGAAIANERPVFRLLLRPEPGVAEPERALRRLLKMALRAFKLRCVSAEKMPPP